MRRTALAAALVFALAASAAAGDGPRTATVKLKTGRSMHGAVLVEGVWEKRDASGAWVAAKRDEAGAGVRVWYVDGLDGFLFVRAADVTDVSITGPFGDAEKRAAEKQRTEAERRAAEERKALAEKRAKQAEADAAAAEEARKSEEAAAGARAKAEHEARVERWKKLLDEFPADLWKVETPAEIDRRRIVMDLLPTAQEKRFLAVFEDWKLALEWKKAEDERKAKEKAAAQTPAPTPAPAPADSPSK